MKSIPAQWTATGITAAKPAEQTSGMKGIPTRRALLIWCLHIRADNTIADSALGLALQCALDVTTEGQQAIDQAAIAEHDDALNCAEPSLPFLFGDSDAGAGGDERIGERVAGREGDAEGDRRRVDVDGDGCDDFGGAGVDLESQCAFFRGVLREEPVRDGREGGGDDEGGDVLLGPGLERGFDAVLLLDPPGFGEAGEVEE